MEIHQPVAGTLSKPTNKQVSSGPSSRASLAVAEGGFGFPLSGGGQDFLLFSPILGHAIYSIAVPYCADCSFVFATILRNAWID